MLCAAVCLGPRPRWLSFVAHILALSCITSVTIVYAWPLIAHLTTSMPGAVGDHDVATMVWNIGWVQRALNGGGDLLRTDVVLVPFGADLRLHTYGLLQGLLAYPFTGRLGVVGAFNLVLVVTLFLNGAVTYALIHREVRQTLAALSAAIWFMLGTPLLFQFAVGRPAFGSIWIVSGALLTMHSLLKRPQIWKAIALGLLLVAALLSDFQIVLFTVIWLNLYSGYRLWRDGPALLECSRVIVLGLAGLIFFVPFLLIYYPALAGAESGGYSQPGLSDMLNYSFRFWDYFTLDTMPLAYGYELFVAALVAVPIFRRSGSYRFWLVGAIVFLILALGPYLQPTRILLPFAAFSLWPPLSQFRTPARLAMPALVGLAVVAGLVLAHLLSRIRSRPMALTMVVVAIGGRLLFALGHDPIHVQTYPDYAIYWQIADETGDFALLEIPFGVRSGLERIGQGGEVLQYYQHVHGKRLLNGMVARLPGAVFRFYRAHPALLVLSGDSPPVTEGELDRDFAEVLRWSKARYVLVHRSRLTAEQARLIEAFLDRQPSLERLAIERDLVIYRLASRK